MFQPSSIGCHLSTLRRSLAAILAGSALALAGLPGLPAWAATNRAHLDRQVLKAMEQGRRIPVILVAHGELNTLEADLRRTGIKNTVRVPIGHGIATELTSSLIAHFSTRSDVERIIYDAPVQLTDTSGISAHPDLNGRVIINRNFNATVTGSDDAYGHGTAVAGIIAGDGTASAGRYLGIAPEANLINLRVNDGTGAAPTSAIMNAILWAVLNKDIFNIRVLNLSLLASVQESYQTSPIDAAVEYAWLKGIVVVVAAGNNGPNSALYAPANDPYVITVGATDDHGSVAAVDDTLAGFSSYGVTQDGVSKPDFVAPGRRIITTLAPGSTFALNYPAFLVGSQYIQLSGSSVAAPIVSGVVALYVESRPTVRPGQLKGVLLATAKGLTLTGSGAGYPDAGRAIASTGLTGNADHGLDPNNYLKVLYLAAHDLVTLPVVSWDTVSWDSVSWESVSWDSVSWNAVSWSD